MAGAGYKLFNTGDVLTAAQVNTYLMEQTVMVFANAAARTTALSGVVSEGMISYLKDTNAVEVYDGSNWVSSDDPNAIQNTIVDAKGDLISASAADVPARLAVGNNGETLVADSSATTGLRWQGNFAAGKNKVINGAFDIWQRGSSVNLTNGNYSFLADRFQALVNFSAGTASISRQTFTPGTAPVSGYEAQYFHRLNTGTTATYYEINTKIEDVRTLAGQTITFSFWAKASSNITIKNLIRQNFGSGGSANVDESSNFNITTSWVRYSRTLTLGSMSGKTIGTSSFLQIFFYQDTGALGGLDIDIWGLQIEASNTATAFQTATGTLAGEFAAAQRYYCRITKDTGIVGHMYKYTSGDGMGFIELPVPMRVTPTSMDILNVQFQQTNLTNNAIVGPTLNTGYSTNKIGAFTFGQTGLANGTQGYAALTSSAYIGFSAEL